MIYDSPQANKDGGCPNGYKACSSKTKNWSDVVCLKKTSDCPTLKTRFYETKNIGDLGDEWQSTQFDSNMSIAWTKTDSTSGPLEKTYLGVIPCLDPTIIVSHSQGLFSQEVQKQVDECSTAYEGLPKYDYRFKKLERYSISEFDLQTESGVLKTLQRMPNFEK